MNIVAVVVFRIILYMYLTVYFYRIFSTKRSFMNKMYGKMSAILLTGLMAITTPVHTMDIPAEQQTEEMTPFIWYKKRPVQIVAAMGITGVVGYLLATRMKKVVLPVAFLALFSKISKNSVANAETTTQNNQTIEPIETTQKLVISEEQHHIAAQHDENAVQVDVMEKSNMKDVTPNRAEKMISYFTNLPFVKHLTGNVEEVTRKDDFFPSLQY